MNPDPFFGQYVLERHQELLAQAAKSRKIRQMQSQQPQARPAGVHSSTTA
jgi:hypothetical protein